MLQIYSPSTLPEPSIVEVVDLRKVDFDNSQDLLERIKKADGTKASREDAKRIASCWRLLVQGTQSRCHLPPFGVRFWKDKKLFLVASICWKCDNIWIEYNGLNTFYEFDAGEANAKELLALLENIIDEF